MAMTGRVIQQQPTIEALKRVVKVGDLNALKRLYKSKHLPLHLQDPANGWPMLFYAITMGQNEMVNYFVEELVATALDTSSHPNSTTSRTTNNLVDFIGCHALHVAAAAKNEQAFLLYAGKFVKSIHQPNHALEYPIIATTKHGLLSLLRYLLAQGVVVDVQDAAGCTALHHAAAWGYFEICNLLLEHGANPKMKNRKGWLPRDYAWSMEMRDHLLACEQALQHKKPLPIIKDSMAHASSSYHSIRVDRQEKPVSSAYAQTSRLDLRTLF